MTQIFSFKKSSFSRVDKPFLDISILYIFLSISPGPSKKSGKSGYSGRSDVFG